MLVRGAVQDTGATLNCKIQFAKLFSRFGASVEVPRYIAALLATSVFLLFAATSTPAWSLKRDCTGFETTSNNRPLISGRLEWHNSGGNLCSVNVNQNDNQLYNQIKNGTLPHNRGTVTPGLFAGSSTVFHIGGGRVASNLLEFVIAMGDADNVGNGTGRWDSMSLENVSCTSSTGGTTTFSLDPIDQEGLSVFVPENSSCTLSIVGDSGSILEDVVLRRSGDDFYIRGGVWRSEATPPEATITTNSPGAVGTTASLDGSGSTDADGTINSYRWVQVDALNSDTEVTTGAVTLSNANAAEATFTVPSYLTDTNLYFKLTVADDSGNEDVAWITYVVEADTRPRATTVTLSSTNSDPTYARNGDTVTLSFTTSEALSTAPEVVVSDFGGDPLYNGDATGSGTDWSVSVMLGGSENNGAITFTIDLVNDSGVAGEQITALVNDSDGGVTIDTNAPAVDIAAILSALNAGETGTLDGSGSADTGSGASGIASYEWVQLDPTNFNNVLSPSHSHYVTLTNADAAVATFTAPSLSSDNELHFRLTVTDNAGNSASQRIDVDINADATAPTVSEVTPVTTPGTDSTPVVVVRSDEAGTVSYGGSCIGDITTIAADTDTTVTLEASVGGNLVDGTYDDCTVTVTDGAGNASTALTLTSFVISGSGSAPEIAVSSSESGDVTNGGTDTHTGATVGVLKTVTYTVSNSGSAALIVNQITASISRVLTSVDISPLTLTVAQNDGSNDGEATFDLAYMPTVGGDFSFQLSLTNNDSDESPFTINVSGTATIDSTAPQVDSVAFQDSSGADISSVHPGESFQVVVTFNEEMQTDGTQNPKLTFHSAVDGGGSDVTSSLVTDTSATGTWSGDAKTYTVEYTAPSTTISTSVTVASVTAVGGQDLAGNDLDTDNDTADGDFTLIENTAPTVSSVVFQDGSGTDITTVAPGDSFQVVVTFDEAMNTADAQKPTLTLHSAVDGDGTNVTASLVTITSATGTWSSDATTYTVSYTVPSTTISTSVTVASVTAVGGQDAAGNDLDTDNDTADGDFTLIENTAPTVSSVVFQDGSGTDITTVAPGDSFQVVVTFDEAMNTADAQKPTLTLHSAVDGGGTNVTASLVTITSATGTWSSDATTYTVSYTVPSTTISTSVTVASVTAVGGQDAAGNDLDTNNDTANDDLTLIENTAPTLTTVAIASDNATDTSQATIGDEIALSFTASEALGSTPTVSIANTNLTPINISGNVWVATLTVDDTTPTGLVTFTISNLVDANSNRASDVTTTTDNSSVTIDTAVPTLTISAPGEARGPFTATFTFSEIVTGFALADITVGNGTASDFAGTDDVYTAIITPTEHGTVTLDVAAAVAIDGAGNDNAAADQVSVNYIDENYVQQRTSRIISNFMTRRGDAIVSNQPDFTERLNQAGPGSSGAGASFSGEGSYANNRMNFATSLRQMLAANKANKDQRIAGLRASGGAGQEGGQTEGRGDGLKIGQQGGGTQSLGFRNLSANDGAPAGFGLWIRGRWARYENDTNQGDVGLLFIGADYKFNNNFVLGLVAQFDWTDEVDDTDDFKINGRGWMVGPYLVAQLHQNLIFDANFSWGQSDNEVSPFNTYTDSFDGTRWLASAKFTGSFTFGSLHVAPHIGVLYFQERQEAYVDSLSIDIPSQTVKLGRLSFGPKISTTIERKDGTTISPYLGLKGLWDFERSAIVDLTTGLASESTDDIRARVDAGVRIRLPDGLTLNGEGFYDGLGAKDYKSYGGSIRINIPLQRDSSWNASVLGIKSDKATTGYGSTPGDDAAPNGNAAGRK